VRWKTAVLHEIPQLFHHPVSKVRVVLLVGRLAEGGHEISLLAERAGDVVWHLVQIEARSGE
jgi:hypothetical protein